MGFVSRSLSRIFAQLGESIALHYKVYIGVSLIITSILSCGLLYFDYNENIEYLYEVTDSPSIEDQMTVTNYFPKKRGTFDPSRQIDMGRFIRCVIMAKTEDSILNTEVWKELRELDETIRSVQVVQYDSRNYSSLCARWQNECRNFNEYLDLDSILPDIENGSVRLSYPLMFNPKTFNAYVIPLIMGGVNLTQDNFSVQTAKAITLNYALEVIDENDDKIGREWEKRVMEKLVQMDSHWKHIKIFRFSLFTISDEILQNIYYALPSMFVTCCAAGAFAVASALMSDWVKAKPWLGMFGVLSATMATLNAFGILCFFGIPMITLNMAVPFLLIGIGLDDCFVFLASWRRTNWEDPVPKRLSECYADAAVSVTITSVTDMLSFYVGLLTPIRAVQIFSAYAGTGVLIIYLWHIFFFGGTMALFGYLEADNKHGLCWWIKAIPNSKAASMSPSISKMFLTGGCDKDDPLNPLNESENSMMKFFRDVFSDFICNKYTQGVVILVSIVYILLAAVGISQLNEGLELQKLVRSDSDLSRYWEKENQYFNQYSHRIQCICRRPEAPPGQSTSCLGYSHHLQDARPDYPQQETPESPPPILELVIIAQPLDYSSEKTRARVNELLNEIYGMDHITEEYSENWLRDFTRFQNNYKELYDLNITSERDFINAYKDIYVNDGMASSLDVVFDETNSSILATRYIVQTTNLESLEMTKYVVEELRGIVSKYPDLNVTTFHPWFFLVDQFLIMRELTVKLLLVAALVVMAVTVVFIPNVVSALSVLFSILFIEMGVLGFMSFWDINLDLISLLCLIMCIGFSVDFSAHISYAYISSEATSSKERIRESMHCLGWPILQAGISTIIGIIGLLYVPTYSFQANFYIIFLVIAFATFQGLFVLPVLFCIFKPEDGIPFIYSPSRKNYSVKKCKLERF